MRITPTVCNIRPKRFNPGQLMSAKKKHDDHEERLLGEAQKLMRYIAGENLDGGKRLWFVLSDIKIADVVDNEWLFKNKNSIWRLIMNRLIDQEYVEYRKSTVKLVGREYRFLNVDKEFLE